MALFPAVYPSPESIWAAQILKTVKGTELAKQVKGDTSAAHRLGAFLGKSGSGRTMSANARDEWLAVWGISRDQYKKGEATPEEAETYIKALEKLALKRENCNKQTKQDAFAKVYGVPLSTKSTTDSEPKSKGTIIILPDAEPTEPRINDILLKLIFPTAARVEWKPDALIGTSDNQNGLSNAWGQGLRAFQDGPDEALQYLTDTCGRLWVGKERELKRRIGVICEAATKIPIDPGPMATRWSDFRALTGGRLQGWSSNFKNRIDEFTDAFEKHGEMWGVLLKGIDWDSEDLIGATEVRSKIEWLIKECVELHNDRSRLGFDRDRVNLYASELRAVSERLERWSRRPFDKGSGPLTDKKLTTNKEPKYGFDGNWDKRQHVRLKEGVCPKSLPRYPGFIGERRDEQRQRLTTSWSRFTELTLEAEAFIDAVLAKNHCVREEGEFWGEDEYRRRLDGLYRLARASTPEISRILMGYLSLRTTARRGDLERKELAFFKSRYSKRGRTPLTLKGEVPGYRDFLDELISTLAVPKLVSTEQVEVYFKLADADGRQSTVDRIEILKRIWSLKLLSLPDVVELVELPPLLAVLPVARFLNPPRRENLMRVVQAGYGAELRGAASLISRRTFIDRSVVQTTNGEQTVLAYLPRKAKNGWVLQKKWADRLTDRGIDPAWAPEEISRCIWEEADNADLLPVLSQLPHGWGAVLTEKRNKNYSGRVGKYREKEVLAFAKSERGSRYNPVILADVIVLPIKTSRYQTQFMERFLNATNGGALQYGLQGGSLILERKIQIAWRMGDDGVVAPRERVKRYDLYFAIPWGMDGIGEKAPDEVKEGGNVLGIDLGDYGFGWAVTDRAGKVLAKGYEKEPRLKRLRVAVLGWRTRQSFGTFSSSETRLERMRRAATGRIRNHIHDLSLRYGAVPVYEYEISSFEVGSARLRNLYETIKKADAPQNDADWQLAKNLWGNKKAQGAQIGASYTSQTCRQCGRCAAFTLREAKGDTFSVSGGTVELTGIHNGEVSVALADGTYSDKELSNALRAHLRRGSGDSGGSTQDEFVCPYVDCRHVTHADVQAAYNIALKWLWRPETKDTDITTLAVFMNRSPEYARGR